MEIKRNESSLNNKYFGFYKGIVIQNNDPTRRGRVKIFVPQIAAQYFSSTGQSSLDKQIFEARFVSADNIKTFLKECEPYAQLVSIWAEKASPLIGGGNSGFRDATSGTATSSYSNMGDQRNPKKAAENKAKVTTPAPKLITVSQTVDPKLEAIEGPLPSGETTIEEGDSLFKKEADQNVEKITANIPLDTTGTNGAEVLEKSPIEGYFNGKSQAANVDVYNNSLAPQTRPGSVGGSFSIPFVGAMVYVFYENGDLQFPVYFAYHFDENDWHGMYDITDNANGFHYPGNSENVKTDEPFTLRNKTILHQSKGGNFEVTDTDHFENVKISQWSGSFFEMNNNVTMEVASKDKTTIIVGKNCKTTKGSESIGVKGDYDENTDGNKTIKIGNIELKEHFDKWKETMLPVAEAAAQFDLQRATPMNLPGTSPEISIKSGKHNTNPTLIETSNQVNNSIDQLIDVPIPIKSNIGFDINTILPASLNITSAVLTTAVDDKESIPQLSPSSQNGTFIPNPKKDILEKLIQKQSLIAAEFEKNFSAGGTEIKTVLKHKCEVIGVTPNDFKTYRVDAIGRHTIDKVKIGNTRTYNNYGAHPHVEHVANDTNFPCGDYDLVVANRWNVTVGAGGISIKTLGNTFIAGATTTIVGTFETNVGSKGNVNIIAGGKLTLTGDIVSIEHPEQVVVDSNLGITKNIVVGGSTYVDGELYVNHITAPIEVQQTEDTKLFGELDSIKVIGFTVIQKDGEMYVQPVYSLGPLDSVLADPAALALMTPKITAAVGLMSSPTITADTALAGGLATIAAATNGGGEADSVITYPHSHAFRNLPLTLCDGNQSVRKSAQQISTGDKEPASPISNGKKEITLV